MNSNIRLGIVTANQEIYKTPVLEISTLLRKLLFLAKLLVACGTPTNDDEITICELTLLSLSQILISEVAAHALISQTKLACSS